MAENKTQPSDNSVEDYLASVEPKRRREDSQVVLKMMGEVTGLEPTLWGGSMVGFGTYHYKYASGREGDTFIIGFAPRKAAMTVYLTDGFEDKYDDLLGRLGKYKTSKVCLYINKLDDVDLDVLRELMSQSFIYVSGEEGAIHSEKRSQANAGQ